MVRLPHPQSGDSQGQETFLAPSADKQTCNYDTECSNHHPSLSTPRQDEMVNHIYTNLPVNAIVRLVRVKKNNNSICRKIFRPFGFISYIIFYNKSYARKHYNFYNNYKCHHRNKINNLPIKKLLTYLLNCNKRIEKNIRDNDSSGRTKQLFK